MTFAWGTARVRNDPAQYDDLADQWWDPRGHFVSLRWIAKCRAELVPLASRPDAVLVDVACGGGLLAPFIADKGYTHIGIDLSERGPVVARQHGVQHTVRGDINRIPLRDQAADAVVAGQCLEHVEDPVAVLRECCRVLRPGGTLVLDTIGRTWLARLLIITLGENLPLPGMAPKGCHDHRLFVNPRQLVTAAADEGVALHVRGLFPNPWQFISWILGRRPDVDMVPVRSTSVLYQASGVKMRASG